MIIYQTVFKLWSRHKIASATIKGLVGWFVVFGLTALLKQYVSLYRAVSQRERERGEKRWRSVNMSKQPPSKPTAKRNRPLPYYYQIVGRPGTGSLPRTIAPLNHPHHQGEITQKYESESWHSCTRHIVMTCYT